ncbi:hypothetical protein [Nesterenkonia xinjiangensis]|uniref:Uncharacterized protein n=1 Tax=Nesterenkonia xinjiangensis TaxID=225327 RepID=A0A7Z0GJ63_9MICC|nr:hypothetical protein [Nesterenkonia xinjiangensis]NYJ76960.1 hypothetical protein [Nesterenkonia xinjiangensis]
MSTEKPRGRRGRRRVVAPATSGQPEEVESQVFRSASLEAGEAREETSPKAADQGPEGGAAADRKVSEEEPSEDRTRGETNSEETAGTKKPESTSANAPALSPRDRWILDQRPPHWG